MMWSLLSYRHFISPVSHPDGDNEIAVVAAIICVHNYIYQFGHFRIVYMAAILSFNSPWIYGHVHTRTLCNSNT